MNGLWSLKRWVSGGVLGLLLMLAEPCQASGPDDAAAQWLARMEQREEAVTMQWLARAGQKEWGWLSEASLLPPGRRSRLVLITDPSGKTLLTYAVEQMRLEVLRKLTPWLVEAEQRRTTLTTLYWLARHGRDGTKASSQVYRFLKELQLAMPRFMIRHASAPNLVETWVEEDRIIRSESEGDESDFGHDDEAVEASSERENQELKSAAIAIRIAPRYERQVSDHATEPALIPGPQPSSSAPVRGSGTGFLTTYDFLCPANGYQQEEEEPQNDSSSVGSSWDYGSAQKSGYSNEPWGQDFHC